MGILLLFFDMEARGSASGSLITVLMCVPTDMEPVSAKT